MDTTRRGVLRTAGGIVTGSAALGRARATDLTEIGLYLDRGATGTNARELNSLARFVHDLYEPVIEGELRVGPQGVVDVNDQVYENVKTANRVWRRHDAWDQADSNVLLLSSRDTEWGQYGGYADIGMPSCVVSHAERADRPVIGKLVGHEIGHTLGLHHRDGEMLSEQKGTMMVHRTDIRTRQWSDRSRRQLG